jgi:hypothetical protein
MSLTRRNVGQVTRVPMKANTTINMGGIVCADATGYAVPGADSSGLRFLGIAAKGVVNSGANGAVYIPIWTQGTFKLTGSGLAITDQGAQVYAAGAATVAASSTNGIEVGTLSQYISATSGWVTIGAGAGGGDVPSAGIADGAVTLSKLATGIKPNYTVFAVGQAALTTDINNDGLSSAIALALELQTDLTAHFANDTRHITGQQATASFDALDCTDLGELLALTGAMLTAYAAHNADVILASEWAYHDAQDSTHALVSAVTPTTLAEAITRLNDLKSKYNAHELEETGHHSVGTVAADQVAEDDAANGSSVSVLCVGCGLGDSVMWGIIDAGTGSVTGVSAMILGDNYIIFDFSDDPQDAIITYAVFRQVS